MRAIATTLVLTGLICAGTQAEARGCIRGAIVGGIAGHYAGHHAILGAVAGCVAGRQIAKTPPRYPAPLGGAVVTH